MDNWVNLKKVRQTVNMYRLLDYYEITGSQRQKWDRLGLKQVGSELRGLCPIHKGDDEGTFHVNLTKDTFECFSCKVRGNVLDFVAAMEQCSIRDAGLKLQEWFSLDEAVE